MLYAPFNHKDVGEVAARHPGLRLILDHLGTHISHKDEGIKESIDQTAQLAMHPNIHVKMTLAPLFSTAPYPYKNIQPFIRQLVESFGPKRCFWGTDASALLERTTCSYRQNAELFTEHMDFLSSADKEWIMGRGLAECLGWPK